jgi:hypothetical protein
MSRILLINTDNNGVFAKRSKVIFIRLNLFNLCYPCSNIKSLFAEQVHRNNLFTLL